MKDQAELESMVQDWLEEIKPVPPRNPRAAARGRAQFVAQAVSASEFQRHKGWKPIFRKDRFAMNLLISMIVIVGVLFGGGATVNAAKDDLPNEPLYLVKTWSEDVSLQFQDSPNEKVERLLELAQVRVQEMTKLSSEGKLIPDQVRLRLEQHIHQSLQICSNMDDTQLDQTLLQIRDQLQKEDQDMERLQTHAAQDTQPVLLQTHTMLQQQLQLVEEGLISHDMFRNAVRNGFNFGQTLTPMPSTTAIPNGQQNGQPTIMPGGTNTGTSGPTPMPGETITMPGGPNTDPGGPNGNTTPSSTNNCDGCGGNGSGGGGMGGNDYGGNGPGGGGSGDQTPGGGGSGGHMP